MIVRTGAAQPPFALLPLDVRLDAAGGPSVSSL
eukprot:COSAG04_NODE_32542_length_232_cov_0.781955_1_plen_32_part_01